MKTLINFIYTILIGVAVAVFVGLGIWTFYAGPKFPDFPNQFTGVSQPSAAQRADMDRQQQQFDKQMQAYQKNEKPYSKKVSGIALAAGVVFFVIGVLLMKRSDTVGEGLALGGIFSEIYAAIRGGSAQFRPLVFASISLILVMLIILVLNRSGALWPAKTRRTR